MRLYSIILLIICFSASSQIQKDIYPGMTINEFDQVKPGIIPSDLKYNKRGIMINEELNDMKGGWIIDFKDGLLYNAVYAYRERLNVYGDVNHAGIKRSFESCFVSVEACIDDYKVKYGEPSEYFEKDTLFQKVTTGSKSYQILKAVWKLQGMNIEIEFMLNGVNESQYFIPNSEATSFYYYVTIKYLPGDIANQKVNEKHYIGQPVSEFAKLYPEKFPEGINLRGHWSESTNIFGLDDEWYFSFEVGKLNSYGISFYSSNEELTEEVFNKYLAVSDSLVSVYESEYGKPGTYKSKNRKFRHPSEDHHWGYEVTDAKWKLEDKWIQIDFRFSGGKGSYFFVLSLNVYQPDYKYFDE